MYTYIHIQSRVGLRVKLFHDVARIVKTRISKRISPFKIIEIQLIRSTPQKYQ